MNGPVNVLAVFDGAYLALHVRAGSMQRLAVLAESALQARAAVAELIDAVKGVAPMFGNDSALLAAYSKEIVRLEAALLRAGGAP